MGTRSEVKQLPIVPTLGFKYAPDPVARFRFILDDAVRASLPTAMHVYYDRWKSLQRA